MIVRINNFPVINPKVAIADYYRFEHAMIMVQKCLTDATKLQLRIVEASKNIERSYLGGTRQVKRLKKKINDLERSISKKKSGRTIDETLQLNHAQSRLEKLTDYLILESKTILGIYNRLESDCNKIKFENADMDHLRILCKKMEALTADLLCYSLANFKKQND